MLNPNLMSEFCLTCNNQPPMVTELLRILEDADPVRMMEMLMELKDLGTKHEMMDEYDRNQLTRLHYLLGAIVRECLLLSA
jgi:hypothetical protein